MILTRQAPDDIEGDGEQALPVWASGSMHAAELFPDQTPERGGICFHTCPRAIAVALVPGLGSSSRAGRPGPLLTQRPVSAGSVGGDGSRSDAAGC